MDIPKELTDIIGDNDPETLAITVLYTNWRGETSERKIVPLGISFGSTDYHKEKQWLLEVWDMDKQVIRTYALKDIKSWISFPGQ